MAKLSIGIVGVGSMGSLLLEILARDYGDRARISASDVSGEALRRARTMGAESTYRDFEEMLEEESLDAVIIASPPHLHAAHAVAALKRGAYVLLEKPMATCLDEALEIQRHDHGRLMLGFSLYFHDLYREARELLASSLGDPVFQWHVAMGRLPPTPWIGDHDISGGMLNENAAHVLYVFRWYAGEASEVHAYTWRLRDDITIEDNAVVLVRHRGGAVSMLAQSWSGGHRWRKWGIQAEKGRLVVEGYLGGMLRASTPREELVSMDFNKDPMHMYSAELGAFLDAAENGWRPTPSGMDGVRVQEMVEAAYISSRTGRPVRLPLRSP